MFGDNLRHWQEMLREICSPDSFIESGFYYMISSALQRRVWCGFNEYTLYPNIYIIMVAGPGVGKGLVINQVTSMLGMHKKSSAMSEATGNNEVQDLLEEIAENKKKVKRDTDNLLFPAGAQDITYEALLIAIGNSLRTIKLPDGSKPEWAPTGRYAHKSMHIEAEELSSFFKKDSDKVNKFLLAAYYAGDYNYETKNHGKENLRKICVNLLGGTTPGYMQETFEDKILTDGFAARTFFVYEFSDRFTRFSIPAFDEKQKESRAALTKHLKSLSQIVGPVEFDPKGYELMRDVYENKNSDLNRPNKSYKLEGYYKRKNIHMMKMAMVIHFADSLEMKVSEQACKAAIDYLARIEKNMHLALQVGSNRLSGVSSNMVKFIQIHQQVSRRSLYMEFIPQLRSDEFEECLKYITQVSGLVESYVEKDSKGKDVTMMRLKKLD